MLLVAILLVPVAGAGLAYVLPTRAGRIRVVLLASVLHLGLVGRLWFAPGQSALGGWLVADPLGLLVLTLVSVLFLVVVTYAVGALRGEHPRGGRLFASCLLGFLAAASMVCLSHHFALLWVGLESTTLTIAPLIFHRNDRRSLEAVWKYLVLSSVGIAFALLAVFLLATAQPAIAGVRPLLLEDLLAGAPTLDRAWLRIAYIFALTGFGTKMGLAPLHTWKPDTYGEAPNLVGALMSGALTSCAFLGLARFSEVAFAANLGEFIRPLLIGFGLVSLLVAAAFIIGQADIKRLLAYSSIEHMGLLVLGLGIGGVGAYGSVLHALNNGLAKCMLFLVAGNMIIAAGSSVASDMRGMLVVRPISAALMLAGLFAVTGSPPFGLFVSEFSIVSGAIREHHPWVAGATLILLAVIFIGITAMMLGIIFGEPSKSDDSGTRSKERGWLVAGPVGLAALVLMLGLYIPAPMRALLERAATSLGGSAP